MSFLRGSKLEQLKQGEVKIQVIKSKQAKSNELHFRKPLNVIKRNSHNNRI